MQINPVRPAGLDHIVLRVRDVERMIAFYVGMLGCRFEREQPDLGLTQLRAGRSLIDLVTVGGALGQAGGAAPGAEGRNLDHFCLRIEAYDEAAIRAHLTQRTGSRSARLARATAPRAKARRSTFWIRRAI